MTVETIRFLVSKIKANPECAKFLSESELAEIAEYEKSSGQPAVGVEVDRDALSNRYEYFTFVDRSYWVEQYLPSERLGLQDWIHDKIEGSVFRTNLTRADFNNLIKEYDSKQSSGDPFAKCDRIPRNRIFDEDVRRFVGDLVDTAKGRDRFFICYYDKYTVRDGTGGICTVDPHVGTVDILRGVGMYPIMRFPVDMEYFNREYFMSASELTDGDELFRVVGTRYNCFTKERKEKFRLCECEFKDGSPVAVKSMSDCMTYEEHFKRLFGFLPARVNETNGKN